MTDAFLSRLKEVASSGNDEAFSSLLKNKEQSNVTLESNLTDQGSTILMILAAMDRPDLIDVLFKEDPCPEVDQVNNNKTTALVFACSMGHLSTVQKLCAHGADANWAIGSRDTPLTVAAEEGFDDIVSFLCTDQKVAMESKNESGQTALHCACGQGHISTAIILLDNGASIEAADNFQATPLLIACTHGFVDIARMLIGAKV